MTRTGIIEQMNWENRNTFSMAVRPADGDFVFAPGQFNMISEPGIGEAPFSFSSSASEAGTFTHTIRLAGNVVNAIKNKRIGDTVHFRGPYGRGWPMGKAQGKHVVLVAGGIGMAPLRPVVYSYLEKPEQFKSLTLFYGVKLQSDVLFEREIESWAKKFQVGITVEYTIDTLPAAYECGMVLKLFDRIKSPLEETITFMCGPQTMMKFCGGDMVLAGQDAGNVYVSLERNMQCGIAHCGHCQIGPKFVCKDGPVFQFSNIERYPDSIL